MTEGTGFLNYKRELSNEQKIEGEQLLQELEPLIYEYFVCGVERTQEGLKLNFSNGQTFVLYIKENRL